MTVMNSSMTTEAPAPARLTGRATTSARAAQPPLAGCPGVPLPREHFPRRRLTAPAPGAPTMAMVVAQIAGTPLLRPTASSRQRPVPAAGTDAGRQS